MPAIPISYSELHDGEKPTEAQLSELITSFNTDATFMSLAMWSLMMSLYEGNSEKGRVLQSFFIHNLIPPALKSRVERAAALDSDSPRPVFGRWPLLALMKKVLTEANSNGGRDPRNDVEARQLLGNACLMMNDLLFPPEHDERLNAAAGNKEKAGDELMAQMLFQFELYKVPDVYQAIARNSEYFRIFDENGGTFQFSDHQTLSEKFKALAGLELSRYLELYFAIWVLHNNLQKLGPLEINEHPETINFDKEKIFELMGLSSAEQAVFFNRILISLKSLSENLVTDARSQLQWQFDFTDFRNQPLVYNSGSEQGFTCIAYPFLIEKLASGVYHTVLNSWPAKHRDRGLFQGYWGRVFERFSNDRLRDEYPQSPLANRLYTNPYFDERRPGAFTEACDAVIDYGDTLILLEHKGGYLSLEEKYSGDVSKLLSGVEAKFGKAVKQLSRGIERLFHKDSTKRSSFSQLNDDGSRGLGLSVEDLKRIRRIYPVLVVPDFAMTIGFMNRRLRMQLDAAINELPLDSVLHVRPLTLLTIENLEDVLAHLRELRLTDVLDEYARYENSPLSTFDEIFRSHLKAKEISQRRNAWSAAQGERFVDSIMKHFRELEPS